MHTHSRRQPRTHTAATQLDRSSSAQRRRPSPAFTFIQLTQSRNHTEKPNNTDAHAECQEGTAACAWTTGLRRGQYCCDLAKTKKVCVFVVALLFIVLFMLFVVWFMCYFACCFILRCRNLLALSLVPCCSWYFTEMCLFCSIVCILSSWRSRIRCSFALP